MANDKVAGGDTILASRMNGRTIGTTAPSSPTIGWIWVDTNGTRPNPKTWDGSAWNSVAGAAFSALGQLIYGAGSGQYQGLTIGNVGDVLTVVGGNPAWATGPVVNAYAIANLSGSTSMPVAGTTYDAAAMSLSLAAGTWLVVADASIVLGPSGPGVGLISIRTAGNVELNISSVPNGAANDLLAVVLTSVVISGPGTTTYKISSRAGVANSQITQGKVIAVRLY